MATSRFAACRAAFRKLHESGCFIIPNPWDVGSAKWLAHRGFKALASTSSGFAFSRGRADGAVGVDDVLHHLGELVAATDLPVNADFENGHAEDLESLAENVRRCVATGVAGLSIEDAGAGRVYDFDTAVARLRAARKAIDATGEDVMLIGRADGIFHGQTDMAEITRRIAAFAAAGADCLYAPGVSSAEQVAAVVKAAGGKPVNVLMGPAAQLGFAGLADLGVRRISTGGALALSAWAGFTRAVDGLADQRFDGFTHSVTHAELGKVFG